MSCLFFTDGEIEAPIDGVNFSRTLDLVRSEHSAKQGSLWLPLELCCLDHPQTSITTACPWACISRRTYRRMLVCPWAESRAHMHRVSTSTHSPCSERKGIADTSSWWKAGGSSQARTVKAREYGPKFPQPGSTALRWGPRGCFPFFCAPHQHFREQPVKINCILWILGGWGTSCYQNAWANFKLIHYAWLILKALGERSEHSSHHTGCSHTGNILLALPLSACHCVNNNFNIRIDLYLWRAWEDGTVIIYTPNTVSSTVHIFHSCDTLVTFNKPL